MSSIHVGHGMIGWVSVLRPLIISETPQVVVTV